MTAVAPFQVIAGPGTVWVGEVGAAFPTIADAPGSADWTSLGLTDGGVTVTHSQTVTLLTADQTTGPIKAVRTEEGLSVSFALVELTLENYVKALNKQTITTGGSPAAKSVLLHQGVSVGRWALLVRGPSPYGDWNMQYEIPYVVQTEEPSVAYTREDKAVLAVTFTAIEDLTVSETQRFGTLRAQSAAA